MNKIIMLASALCCSGFPVFAGPPSILAPSETKGVLERTLNMPLLMSARPLPRPESIVMKAASVEVPDMAEALSLATAPLTPFEVSLLSDEDAYVLGHTQDALWLQSVMRGDKPSTLVRFALNRPDPEYLTTRVAMAPVPVPILPLDPMVEVIRKTLSGTYDMSSHDGDSGYNRLLSLAEGNGYARTPATISADAYVKDPEPVLADVSTDAQEIPKARPTVMGMDPAVAILNSLSKDLLVNLSPEQLSALVMAAQGQPVNMQSLNAAHAPANFAQAPSLPAQPLSGIPSLDYRGNDLPVPQVISASDVPSGSMPFDTSTTTPSQIVQAAPPEPVRVGDGQNLLLKGWSLGITASGEIGMYMVGDPSSIVEISEGMVMGPFGSVESLRMENGKIIAKFSTGEEMVSPATRVSMASL